MDGSRLRRCSHPTFRPAPTSKSLHSTGGHCGVGAHLGLILGFVFFPLSSFLFPFFPLQAFDCVIQAVFRAATAAAIARMSPFIRKSGRLVRNLALTSVQLHSATQSAPLCGLPLLLNAEGNCARTAFPAASCASSNAAVPGVPHAYCLPLQGQH